MGIINPYDVSEYKLPPHRKEIDFFGKLRGRRAVIVLNNDDELEGTIVRYNRFEVLIRQDETEETEETDLLVMKHAIRLIIPEEARILDKKPEMPEPVKTEEGGAPVTS